MSLIDDEEDEVDGFIVVVDGEDDSNPEETCVKYIKKLNKKMISGQVNAISASINMGLSHGCW